MPRTIIGDDGVLRSSAGDLDPSTFPQIKGSYGALVIEMTERKIKELGDRVLLTNAMLGE